MQKKTFLGALGLLLVGTLDLAASPERWLLVKVKEAGEGSERVRSWSTCCR